MVEWTCMQVGERRNTAGDSDFRAASGMLDGAGHHCLSRIGRRRADR
jgi:hypothetical protein